MFTDMEGYTAMMREDEENAIHIRNRHREIFESLTKRFRGTIVQYFGDGTLTTFDSSVDAVECALELQKEFRKDPIIPVRIGIHVGDIVFMDNDIMGDAVNIASRIESVAIAGGIFISGQVNDQLRSHKKLRTQYLDVFNFKNVKEPIPVFALVAKHLNTRDPSETINLAKRTNNDSFSDQDKSIYESEKSNFTKVAGIIAVALVLLIGLFYTFRNVNSKSAQPLTKNGTSQNSIAILPVQNFSGIEKNDFLCKSIADGLLQELSNKIELGKVVPKSLIDDFFKSGKQLADISNTLGVRYLLEGALHYTDSVYSLDVRLVDPMERTYLWSNRYANISEINYMTEIQSNIGLELASQIKKDIGLRSIDKGQEGSDNEKVTELLQRANTLTNQMDKESMYQALPLYEKIVLTDPDLADGYMGLGRIYVIGGLIWGIFEQEEAAAKSTEYLQTSMALRPTLEASQFLLMAKFFFEQDFQYADENLSLVAILPPFPDGGFYSVYCNTVGRYEESIRYSEKYAKRFPESGSGFAQMIRGHFLAGNIKQADSLMKRYDSKFGNDQFYMRDVAMVHLNRGHKEAFKQMNQILKTNFLDNASVHLFYDAMAMTFDGEEPVKVQERLGQLQDQYNNGMAGSPAWFLAMYHLHMGDTDSAFEWLNKSQERKEVEMVWFKTEYLLQPFRKAKDPRYMAIYNQIDWPE